MQLPFPKLSEPTMQTAFIYDDGPRCASHFTGKERDSETGLDDFGTRVYSSSIGRFMTPDPLFSSGHPGAPQRWNRYEYASNTPLVNIDPDGMYDVSCQQGDQECKANAERLKAARAQLQILMSKSSGAQQMALNRALNAIGTENDHNGVNVVFGPSPTGGAMTAQTGNLLTVDFKQIDSRISEFSKQGNNFDVGVVIAAGLAHEGTHIADYNDPSTGMSQLSPKLKNVWDMDEYFEVRAYMVESFAYEAAGKDGISGVWNTSWATSADKELLRRRAVKRAAKDSVEATRAEWESRTK